MGDEQRLVENLPHSHSEMQDDGSSCIINRLFPGSSWGLSLSLAEGRGGLQGCMYEKFTWSRPMSGFDVHPYSAARGQSQGHTSLQETVRNTCLPKNNTC